MINGTTTRGTKALLAKLFLHFRIFIALNDWDDELKFKIHRLGYKKQNKIFDWNLKAFKKLKLLGSLGVAYGITKGLRKQKWSSENSLGESDSSDMCCQH